ncbi:MAG: hypothetical protein N2490_03275 [Ignavibacteria bacterium]|nr:hypothetical protein [Ignavibacteria bacterium]
MAKVNQPPLIGDSEQTDSHEDFDKAKSLFVQCVDRLTLKIGLLIERIRRLEDENQRFKESVNDLNNRLQEIKLELAKTNSDSVLKDKEILNLKSIILGLQSNKSSLTDKENIKSRIKELIARIDTHLEQYGENYEEDE